MRFLIVALLVAISYAQTAQNCTPGCSACGYNWYALNWNDGNSSDLFKHKRCECCNYGDDLSIFDACVEQCSNYTVTYTNASTATTATTSVSPTSTATTSAVLMSTIASTSECYALPPEHSRNGTAAIYLYEIGYRSCYLNGFEPPLTMIWISTYMFSKLLWVVLCVVHFDNSQFDEEDMQGPKMMCKLFFSALDAVAFCSEIYFALKEGFSNKGFDWGWNSFIIGFLGLLGRQSISILFCDASLRAYTAQKYHPKINPYVCLDLGFWATIVGVILAITYILVALFLIVCILAGTLLIPGVVLLLGLFISTCVLQLILLLPISCALVLASWGLSFCVQGETRQGDEYLAEGLFGLGTIMWPLMIVVQSGVVMTPFATKYHPWFGDDENKISFLFLEYVKALYNFPELMTSFNFVFSVHMFDPEMPQFVLFLSLLGVLIKIVQNITLYCFFPKDGFE